MSKKQTMNKTIETLKTVMQDAAEQLKDAIAALEAVDREAAIQFKIELERSNYDLVQELILLKSNSSQAKMHAEFAVIKLQ